MKNIAVSIVVLSCLVSALPSCRKNPEPTPGPDPGQTETEKTKKDFKNPELDPHPLVDYTKWSIHDGKFWLDGKWVFVKTAKPLTDYSSADNCQKVINMLDKLRSKYYNAVSINCYWHHFDKDGDGEIDFDLAPLNRLINAIYSRGMYPCLCVETYSVGGGSIADPFWERYPDAFAVDSDGKKTYDTEYGFGSKVVSIFHKGYREAEHKYIENLAKGLGDNIKKILYFETTVEPQYMGDRYLCYSESAKEAYAEWRKKNNITDKASEMPSSFPIDNTFIKNATWNKFRAQALAEWINEDAAVWRSVAGKDAYVAVDYLDTITEDSMIRRDGNPEEFLRALTCPNIIQLNWHWHGNGPNQAGYDRLWKIIKETGRDWAVSEHMTFGGSSGGSNADQVIDAILLNTLTQGTRFGWDFTNTFNRNDDSFSLYNDDWSPKRVMKNVDNYWGWWLYQMDKIEKEKNK